MPSVLENPELATWAMEKTKSMSALPSAILPNIKELWQQTNNEKLDSGQARFPKATQDPGKAATLHAAIKMRPYGWIESTVTQRFVLVNIPP